ncbi:MAG: hypothetical protein RL014_2953 [Pseudomonadota bacterium]|jgi:hypothetical protein
MPNHVSTHASLQATGHPRTTPLWRSALMRYPHALALGAALLLSLGVLALYQHPDILVALAEQLWACL